MIRVIDAVLEDIRLGLELPVVNQRRISSVKFLGELYNYQLIDAALIFRVLYLFISFGCRSDGGCGRYMIIVFFDWFIYIRYFSTIGSGRFLLTS